MEIIVDEIPKYYDIMYVDADNNKSAQKTYGVIRKDDEVIITEVIKIYTPEQLLAINSEKEPNESEYFKTYILMNDIKFKVSDFEIDYWKPIGEIEIVDGQFEGYNKEIHVTYVDSDNEEYTIVYNKENNYSEIEYEFNILPIIREEEKIAEDASIIIDKNGEQTEAIGQQTLKAKRGADTVKVSANMNSISYKKTETVTIEIKNPNKINFVKNESKEDSYYVSLLIEYNYITFTINAIPNDATVIINNKTIEGNGAGVFSVDNIVAGRDSVSWKVSAENYVEQSGNKSASEIIDNISINVELKKWVKLTIIQPVDSSLVINSINGNCKEEGFDENSNKYLILEEGAKVTYSLTKAHFHPIDNGEITVNEDKTITLELEPIMVTFTINPTPSDAIVTINGGSTKTTTIQEGSSVTWVVSMDDGYIPQSDTIKEVNEDTTINVALVACLKKSESYVGYYADIEGDGTVDGIIYVDLAHSKSGVWWNSMSGKTNFEYTAKESLNNYYISQDSYKANDAFGTKAVISPIDLEKDTMEENDRFYVMALNDITSEEYSTFYFYYNGYKQITDYSTLTSTSFGSGKINTKNVMERWKTNYYGTGVERDLWNYVDEEINNGWFIPSRGEWCAFAYNFGGQNSNIKEFLDFDESYWSSSLSTKSYAWAISDAGAHEWLHIQKMDVRLSTTF